MQTDTRTPTLPAWALGSLRCPGGGASLKRVGDGFQAEDEQARVYPDTAGRPRLMQELVWRGDGGEGAGRGGESFARRLNARLKGAASLNLASARNYRSLRALLESEHSRDAPARVLVIGGGELGAGLEQLVDSDRIELLESDVYPGPRVQILCDVHQLPFADGSFDAVVAQAVLEHVLDPPTAAREIHRVLRPPGIVYSEIPFMQQVHEGPFDFTRFTELGQRRLFRMFDELDRGPVAGPGTVLAWSFRYLARSVPRRPGPAVAILDRIAVALTFWVKYADRLVLGHPGARDGASGTYFLGRRREQPVSDAEIIDSYRGAVAVPSRRVAR
jgi:SAM-dependent methyltransferase